ncbi:MAG: ferredoxin family protein [Methanomassiliicoccales archaeon]|nr:ferredoxin family protein [Methanomassiliicoccales archaeon]
MQVKVNPRYCKGCNLCVKVCPNRAFDQGNELSERGYFPPVLARPEKCANFKRKTRKNAVCELCVLTCPDQALTWDEEGGVEG